METIKEINLKKRCSSEETRAKILCTANRLFYEKGIKSVGIDTIISESGVAKMSLYKHFPSKEHLVIEYLNKRDKEFFDIFEKYLDNVESKNPILDYFTFLNTIYKENNVNHCPFLNVMVEFPDISDELYNVIFLHKKKILEKLENTLKRMKLDNIEKRAEHITLIWHGFIINKQLFRKNYDTSFFEIIESITTK